MFSSCDTNENKKPKTKAFEDTIQKVTNASPRQNALLSVLMIHPKTKTQKLADLIMKINKCEASILPDIKINCHGKLLHSFTSSN